MYNKRCRKSLQTAACVRVTEKYSRGRRGAPAKGVGRLSRRESSNLSFSAKRTTIFCVYVPFWDTKYCGFCYFRICIPLTVPTIGFCGIPLLGAVLHPFIATVSKMETTTHIKRQALFCTCLFVMLLDSHNIFAFGLRSPVSSSPIRDRRR